MAQSVTKAVKFTFPHCRNSELVNIIKQKLMKRFNPVHVEIIDESHLHEKHKNAQTHYTVYIKSESFRDKTMSQRHQEVIYELEDQLIQGVYAFYIIAKTPEQ